VNTVAATVVEVGVVETVQKAVGKVKLKISGLGKLVQVFYIHGSVHRDSILIRSNEMQQYAGVYLLQNYSICFGCLSHPSSGVQYIVQVL
jgi:hypothetical protein